MQQTQMPSWTRQAAAKYSAHAPKSIQIQILLQLYASLPILQLGKQTQRPTQSQLVGELVHNSSKRMKVWRYVVLAVIMIIIRGNVY